MSEHFEAKRAKNSAESEILCKAASEAFAENVRVAATSVEYMFQEFKAQLWKYIQSAKGPYKLQFLEMSVLNILEPILGLHSDEISNLRESLEADKKSALGKASQDYQVI